MTSEEAVGPFDIAKLLALLNASEDDTSQDGATPGNRGQTVLPLCEPEQSAEKIDLQEEIDLHREVLPRAAAQSSTRGRLMIRFGRMSRIDLQRTSSMAWRSSRPGKLDAKSGATSVRCARRWTIPSAIHRSNMIPNSSIILRDFMELVRCAFFISVAKLSAQAIIVCVILAILC